MGFQLSPYRAVWEVGPSKPTHPPSEEGRKTKNMQSEHGEIHLLFAPPALTISRNSVSFDKFDSRARILAFGDSRLPIDPRRAGDYNDDASLPIYVSSPRTYAGKKSKGLQEEHLEPPPLWNAPRKHRGSYFPSRSRRRFPLRYRAP